MKRLTKALTLAALLLAAAAAAWWWQQRPVKPPPEKYRTALVDRVPGIFFGLPLVALASLVFAATHHEDPAAIRLATIHWTVWLGGILGMVLAGVLVLGLFS